MFISSILHHAVVSLPTHVSLFFFFPRMDFTPRLRRTGTRELILQPSAQAAQVQAGPRSAAPAKAGALVQQEARARVQEAGGDPRCDKLVLSESELQFGKYRGQTFRWVLSNDLGWAVYLMVAHLKDREGNQAPLAQNKDALTAYMRLFPEVRFPSIVAVCQAAGRLEFPSEWGGRMMLVFLLHRWWHWFSCVGCVRAPCRRGAATVSWWGWVVAPQ